MYKDIITLIAVTKGQDADGFPAEVEHPHDVFADKKSVSRAEFYSSLQAGATATAVFNTRKVDFDESTYDGVEATRLEHDGKKYKILRTYSKDDEMLEITCTDLGVGA
ncbi:phage head completion protein [Caproiciproducens sp.]